MSGTELGYLLLSGTGIALLVGGAVWNAAASRAESRGASFGPKARTLIVPGLGLVLTIAGGFFLTLGPSPLTPEERKALMAKFNDELNTVVARCNADGDTLRQRRITATAGVAAARLVLSAKADADEAARQQTRSRNQRAEDTRTAARTAADLAREDALRKADVAAQSAQPTAEHKKNSRNEDSEAQYKEALRNAQAISNLLQRDAAQKKAREDRDRSLDSSAAEYNRDLASANTAWNKAQVDAEAERIRAYEVAESAYQIELEAAARDYSRASEAVAENAANTLRAIPEAAAVTKEFDDRERELNDRCERDKADIAQRMREQLGARR